MPNTTYAPAWQAPNGANEGDVWINQTTGLAQTWQGGQWRSEPMAGQLAFGGVPAALLNLKYVPLVGSNLATGNTDLYTCPVGRKALILGTTANRVYNPSGGSITYYYQLKVSGVYYRLAVSTTLTTLTGSTASLGQAIILNAGESIAINTATTAGLNLRGNILEFDATDVRVATARILALASGDNTLLTCPTNASILLITATASISNAGGQIVVANDSGGSLDYYANVVPSGGSPGSTNQLFVATAVADDAVGAFAVGATLAAGDFVNVNASGVGGMAWLNYYQIPLAPT